MTSRTTVCFLQVILLLSLGLYGCGGGFDVSVTPAGETSDEGTTDTVSTIPVQALTLSGVVDTGQNTCYGTYGIIADPQPGQQFNGQDAQYQGLPMSYYDNGDGTVTDMGTGLMWQQDPGEKMYRSQAVSGASSFRLAGYDDWRLPTIKELYSLIDFTGSTGMSAADSIPYINTDYFYFEYGDPSLGERFIDAQFATSTEYVSTTMGGAATMFGVNFADGRIKGYPREKKTYFVLYVRGDRGYGVNDFVDNGDGTVTDRATGLMWMQMDSGFFGVNTSGDGGMNWEESLAWAEALEYAGFDDWRLPNAKELQGIVDYTRSPDTTGSAAIDSVFVCSTIIDEGGGTNYPFYWTGTSHLDGVQKGAAAVYVAFGEALGWVYNPWYGYLLYDVHGAGAQRSDPKAGDPDDYPYGFGPQGDVRRIYNYVRCVRNAD